MDPEAWCGRRGRSDVVLTGHERGTAAIIALNLTEACTEYQAIAGRHALAEKLRTLARRLAKERNSD